VREAKYLGVSIDETPDASGRNIADVVIESLKNDETLSKLKSHHAPLPPSSPLWGTWLDVIVYYVENLEIFFSAVNELSRDAGTSVAILQEISGDLNELRVLKINMAHIRANVSFLSQSVTKFEKATNFLSETIAIRNELNKINGSEADALQQKFRVVFNRNGFKLCAGFRVCWRERPV
jgi:hypothetical protein